MFELFGVKRRRVASFEEPVKLLSVTRGFIDLFWKGVLLVDQKSAGRNLAPAKTQALDYFPGLKDAELPRYILLSDFQTFELHDLDEGTEPVRFAPADLPRNVEVFGFIIGAQKRTFPRYQSMAKQPVRSAQHAGKSAPKSSGREPETVRVDQRRPVRGTAADPRLEQRDAGSPRAPPPAPGSPRPPRPPAPQKASCSCPPRRGRARPAVR
ncbi:MAG: type IIL restriction-modification enzyme MmeI [Acetobacteraceae bacterium]